MLNWNFNLVFYYKNDKCKDLYQLEKVFSCQCAFNRYHRLDEISGVWFSFKDITYTLTNFKKKHQILKGVSATVPPGTLLAIMGASGFQKNSNLLT
jgi:ABC-type multidrug transport system fused ATPase/permease subunit